jgi:hypothetical protein
MVEVIEPSVKVRFCTSCQADREEATGEVKVKGKIKRWVCRSCLDRKTDSIYRNVSKEKR